MPPVKGRITLDKIVFRYRPEAAPVLSSISLDITAGEIIGIVGRSGSGKSTLTKLVQRLYVPEQGRLMVDGIDISLIDAAQLRRQVGVVLQENDATAGNRDTLQFTGGIATNQIWLRQVSNNLEVSVIGTADKMTISNWYLGSQYRVEEIKTSDGKVLLDSQVQNLVQAMASFAPPAAGQTTLNASQQAALATLIAANWQ